MTINDVYYTVPRSHSCDCSCVVLDPAQKPRKDCFNPGGPIQEQEATDRQGEKEAK